MVKCYIPELFICQTVINTFSTELNEKKTKQLFCALFFLAFTLWGFFSSLNNMLIKLLMSPKMKPSVSWRHLISYISVNCCFTLRWKKKECCSSWEAGRNQEGTWMWTTWNLISPPIRTCHCHFNWNMSQWNMHVLQCNLNRPTKT